MARAGNFFRGAEPYGASLSVVHPPDNNVQAARWDPAIASLKTTDAQKDELQRLADNLFATETIERDYYGNPITKP